MVVPDLGPPQGVWPLSDGTLLVGGGKQPHCLQHLLAHGGGPVGNEPWGLGRSGPAHWAVAAGGPLVGSRRWWRRPPLASVGSRMGRVCGGLRGGNQ